MASQDGTTDSRLPPGRFYERHPRIRLPLLLFFGLSQGWYFFLYSHHYEIQ
jgi:hypothetical protein